MDRALLVGINQYQFERSLTGCVNDINAVAEFLTTQCGFVHDAIRQLSDLRATRKAIDEHLKWLIKDLSPGDRIVFHYSGHGAQLATRDAAGEVDGRDEVICPSDYNGGDNAIRDKDFLQLFQAIPRGVRFVWISDSCFSGDLTRVAGVGRFLPPHNDISWRIRTATSKSVEALTFRGAANALNLAFISACADNELALETQVGPDRFGVLTHFLLRRLREADGLTAPLRRIVSDVSRELEQNRFFQRPQLEGTLANTGVAFLGAPAQPVLSSAAVVRALDGSSATTVALPTGSRLVIEIRDQT